MILTIKGPKRYGAASYAQARAAARLDREALAQASMWFLTPAQLQAMPAGSVDLALNVASFMEMSGSVVGRYLAEFDRIAQFGHVYLRNQIYGVGSRYADYPIPAHWRQKYFRASPTDPSFYETAFRVEPGPFSFG